MEDNRKEAETENSVKEIRRRRAGGRNVCRYLCRRRGFGTGRSGFQRKIGIETLERRPGYAKCEIKIEPWHFEMYWGVIHGGVPVFTGGHGVRYSGSDIRRIPGYDGKWKH